MLTWLLLVLLDVFSAPAPAVGPTQPAALLAPVNATPANPFDLLDFSQKVCPGQCVLVVAPGRTHPRMTNGCLFIAVRRTCRRRFRLVRIRLTLRQLVLSLTKVLQRRRRSRSTRSTFRSDRSIDSKYMLGRRRSVSDDEISPTELYE